MKGYSLTVADIARNKPTPEAESIFKVHDVLEKVGSEPKRVLRELAEESVPKETREQILGRVAAAKMEGLMAQGFFKRPLFPQRALVSAVSPPGQELKQPEAALDESLRPASPASPNVGLRYTDLIWLYSLGSNNP